MKWFFSCDWGSTRFRLRLIEANTRKVVVETGSDNGVVKMHEAWRTTRKKERQEYFSDYLSEQVEKISQQTDLTLEEAPIIVSGMASSNIGLLELPYKKFPIKTDGSDLTVERISSVPEHRQPLYLISGARTDEDVVRGEETMMVGWDHVKEGVSVLIFPGTHSKHVFIRDGMAQKIQSFMTGEMFNLLSTMSILKNSIQRPEGYEFSTNRFFAAGVSKGATANFLNSVFHVRINDLFKTATPEENYAFLAGMLIGYELKELKGSGVARVGLVCSEDLNAAYLQALTLLYPGLLTVVQDAGSALINGQWKILQELKSRSAPG